MHCKLTFEIAQINLQRNRYGPQQFDKLCFRKKQGNTFSNVKLL